MSARRWIFGCARIRHRRTRGQSRKTIRLIHTARSIVWEVCASHAAARLRETIFCASTSHPASTAPGTWPLGWYVTVETAPDALQLRLVREPVPGCHGAFRGGVQSALLALTQLIWLALHETHRSQPFCSAPHARIPRTAGAFFSPSWADALNAYLAGESDSLLQRVTRPPESLSTPFERAFH